MPVLLICESSCLLILKRKIIFDLKKSNKFQEYTSVIKVQTLYASIYRTAEHTEVIESETFCVAELAL